MTTKTFSMIRRARQVVREEKHELPDKKSKIEVVVLGIDQGENTVNKIISEVCEDLGIKQISVNVEEAWISDQDVEMGTLTVSNYDGEDSKEKVTTKSAVVFARRGAIMTMSGQALTSTFESAGCFMINDLESMLLCDNKMASAIQLMKHNVAIPSTSIVNSRKSIEDTHNRIGGKFTVIIKISKCIFKHYCICTMRILKRYKWTIRCRDTK